jgi:hypothetical protein
MRQPDAGSTGHVMEDMGMLVVFAIGAANVACGFECS